MTVLLFFLLLVGCATPLTKTVYPDTCTFTQPDKDGAGYTTGIAPCVLKHMAGPEPKKP